MIRRIKLPFKVKRPILACGADMKGAFAVAKGDACVVVDGFGDLGDLDNFTRYENTIGEMLKKLKIRPEIIACDLHPGYFSTRFAEDRTLHPVPYTLCPIQHHEAHVASAIVGNAIKGDVIGVAFDGTGFGSDGNIWGGEFFVGNAKGFKREARFDYMPMPGADKAIQEPWRMAVSYLKMGRVPFKIKYIPIKNRRIIETMIENGINSPLTSSAGRLFDAVGSLMLARGVVTREAELPMEMERIAVSSDEKYNFSIKKNSGIRVINVSKVIKGVTSDLLKNTDRALISAKFHNTIAGIISRVSLELGRRFHIKKVILSGGVFQNRRLSDKVAGLLEKSGLALYRHSGIPVNDSGIPVGQIAIVHARTRCA